MKQRVIGVIGGGRIGKMHINNLISSVPSLKIKGVVDPHVESGWVESLNIPLATSDIRVLLEDQEIDSVLIATPSAFHVDIIKQAAEAGKDIFCEKPIAFLPEQVQEAVDAVEKAGVKLFVGYNRRFDKNFSKIRQHVQNGDVGEIQLIKIVNRDPKRPSLKFVKHSGGLFMDFTAHDFDMARYITGSEVKEISVMGAAFIPGMEDAGDIDTALINLRMENGALVSIDNSRETLYGYDQRLEVFGSKGSVQALNETPTRLVFHNESAVFSDKPHYSFIERYKDAYIEEMKQFADCLVKGTPIPIDGNDALSVVKIAQAAQQSLVEKRSILL